MAKAKVKTLLDTTVVWNKNEEEEPKLNLPEPNALLQLGKLARERNEIEYQISDAGSTVVSLEGLGGYDHLIAQTKETIEKLKDRKAELDRILATMNTVAANRKVDRRYATPPPARGKLLNPALIYSYMDQHPDGKAIIAEEFWMQVNKETDNGCWEVRFEVTKNRKGTVKKAAHIPWLGKALPATRLAWYLTGQAMDDVDSNIYNECGNVKCVNPAHHYQGALGKIKKQLAREKAPNVLPATFQELNEWVDAVFDFVCGKLNKGWAAEHGFTFKELVMQFVPDEIPTEDDLRKALNCQRGKTLFSFVDGKWYAAGMQQVKR